MNIFHRRKKWQRVVRNAAKNVADNQGAKAGAGTLAGLTALTAVSAVMSSRRKTQP